MTAALSEDRVREIVGEALTVALPVTVKLIENYLEARLGAALPLHGWRDRP